MNSKKIKQLDDLARKAVKLRARGLDELTGKPIKNGVVHHIMGRAILSLRWEMLNLLYIEEATHTIDNDSAHSSPEDFNKLIEKIYPKRRQKLEEILRERSLAKYRVQEIEDNLRQYINVHTYLQNKKQSGKETSREDCREELI